MKSTEENWQLVMVLYFVSDTLKILTTDMLVVFHLVWPELTEWLPSKCCCGGFSVQCLLWMHLSGKQLYPAVLPFPNHVLVYQLSCANVRLGQDSLVWNGREFAICVHQHASDIRNL
jgi:hypothetical protein